MKNQIKLLFLAMLCLSAPVWAQQVQLPQASPRAEIAQTIGDTRVAIVYYRPSVKGREIFGKLEPYGKVWRTGANWATTFETSENVKINGQDLPAGKYSLHTIPDQTEWTIIFNKTHEQWGSFQYKQTEDALRVRVKPQTAPMMRETLAFDFETVEPRAATVVLEWEKVRLPFTVDVGDVNARVLPKLRKAIADAKPDDQRAQLQTRTQTVGFIVNNQLKENYTEAQKYIDEAIKMSETYGTLSAKARLLAAMENYKEAVATGEKAVAVGKAAQPPVNPDALANFEKDLSGWRTKNK